MTVNDRVKCIKDLRESINGKDRVKKLYIYFSTFEL